MPIPNKLKSLDELPEAFRDAYEEVNGEYVLKEVPGFAPSSKLNEFRDNNKAKDSEIAELRAAMEPFKDLDPEKYRQMQEQARLLEEKKLIDAGEIDPIVEARMKPVVAKKDETIQALTNELETSNKTLSRLLIEDRGLEKLVAKGLQPDMVKMAKTISNEYFAIKDGKTIAVDADGQPRYEDDGITPMQINDSWADRIKAEHPSMFIPPSGGDANDSNSGRRAGNQDTANMTAVQKIHQGMEEAG